MTARLTRRLLLATTTIAVPSIARAQARRPLRIVIPFPPGGSVDGLGRVLADRLAPVLEQSVVVDNRSGGGGLIGADAVAKAPPDGTTIGVIGAATLCAAPFLQQTMPFDVARDFRAITQISDSAVLLAVNTEVATRRGWTDMAALLAWCRANPGVFKVSHAGAATVSHLTLAALSAQSRAEFNQIPYRGGAQMTADLLNSTIEGSADLPTALVPQLEAGRIRILGTSSGRRLGMLPAIPAFAETPGLEGFDIRSWNMIVTAAATPAAEVERLAAAIRQVGSAQSFKDAMRPLGYDAVVSESTAAAAALIASETPKWQRLVEVSGARVN
jgi:tripartite-type tricarboxylate transporter receptor subunit TctC